MVNKLQGNYANLNALLAQSVNSLNHINVSTGLQSRAHLAPSTATITDEMLSQFSDEQVDEILNQVSPQRRWLTRRHGNGSSRAVT